MGYYGRRFATVALTRLVVGSSLIVGTRDAEPEPEPEPAHFGRSRSRKKRGGSGSEKGYNCGK